MNVLVFDIETVPDVAGGSKLHGLQGLSDADAAQALFKLRHEENGTEFLRLHLQQVVAISAVFRTADKVAVWSLGEPNDPEPVLLQRFFELIDRYSPTLVSWNGSGFDLPVMHYRALRHRVQAPRYWETGQHDNQFKWNNYISRYHDRHTDLMEVLGMYQPRAYVPLDQIATLLGFPGKMGMSGSKVWETYQGGDIKSIRDYCETDVLNTWLVYLRFLLMKAHLDEAGYEAEVSLLKEYLEREAHAHFLEFLAAIQ